MRTVHQTSRTRAFTITEMLVTVGVIVILASILVAALAQAGRAAQKGKTAFLMSSIKDGLARFQTDHGYLPPLLGSNGTSPGAAGGGYGRDLLGLPGGAYDLQGAYSLTTLPEYLLGYGDRQFDGYGYVASPSALLPPDDSLPGHREHPALGIRSPGPDGFWNGTINPRFGNNRMLYANRNPGNLDESLSMGNGSQMPGRVYGPYIDLKDGTVLGEVSGLQFDNGDVVALRQTWDRVILPGEDGYGMDDNPKVFLDYWGNPIRFYRRPQNHISTPDVMGTAWSLGDVIALRPTSYDIGMDTMSTVEDANADGSTLRGLISAEYALFSPGADGKNVDSKRFDDVNGYNADNMVEVGP